MLCLLSAYLLDIMDLSKKSNICPYFVSPWFWVLHCTGQISTVFKIFQHFVQHFDLSEQSHTPALISSAGSSTLVLESAVFWASALVFTVSTHRLFHVSQSGDAERCPVWPSIRQEIIIQSTLCSTTNTNSLPPWILTWSQSWIVASTSFLELVTRLLQKISLCVALATLPRDRKGRRPPWLRPSTAVDLNGWIELFTDSRLPAKSLKCNRVIVYKALDRHTVA